MATPLNLSVFKSFALLEVFQEAPGPLSSADLARRARLPASSCYRLAQTLVQAGVLVKCDRGRYRLGPVPAALGRAVDLVEIWGGVAEPVMAELSERLGVTLQLGVLDGSRVTVLAKTMALRSIYTPVRVGGQVEAHGCALGKVLLAHQPVDRVDSLIFEGGLRALTRHTLTNPLGVLAQLEASRHEGYGFANQEAFEGICCVAAPVIGRSGRALAALSASEGSERMIESRQRRLVEALQETAMGLRARLQPLVREVPALRAFDELL